MADVRINDVPRLMKVEFLTAEVQRHPALSEGPRFHPENTLVEADGPGDAPDGKDQVIETIHVHDLLSNQSGGASPDRGTQRLLAPGIVRTRSSHDLARRLVQDHANQERTMDPQMKLGAAGTNGNTGSQVNPTLGGESDATPA